VRRKKDAVPVTKKSMISSTTQVTKGQVATPNQAEVVPLKVSTHYAHTMAKKKRAASPPASFVAMKQKR
jgi:hypothetical protein